LNFEKEISELRQDLHSSHKAQELLIKEIKNLKVNNQPNQPTQKASDMNSKVSI